MVSKLPVENKKSPEEKLKEDTINIEMVLDADVSIRSNGSNEFNDIKDVIEQFQQTSFDGQLKVEDTDSTNRRIDTSGRKENHSGIK